MRVAFYARYSSDLQSPASIDDQIRICQDRATKEGWTVAGIHVDHAISGDSMLRPGFQNLMRAGMRGEFDIVLAEAMDRLSRDQEDIAAFYKRMEFAEIQIITLSEGVITAVHVGLTGTMNSLFLKNLAAKTHRGLEGRGIKGKSGGGITFGYDVVKQLDAQGKPVTGERTINEAEADVVRSIFTDYARYISPRAIAKRLNAEGVPGPQGGEWGASTIYGNRDRGTGILNNELYIGKLVWNRLRYVKDPETRKRRSRLNSASEHVITDVPELRIVDQDLWSRAKEVQGKLNKHDIPLHARARPRSLLAGLTKCGCCGASFTGTARGWMGCGAHRDKGTCNNSLRIKQDVVVSYVLKALQTHLMDERVCEEFCRTYTREMNRLRAEASSEIAKRQKERGKLEREKAQLVQSIKDGVPAELLKEGAIDLQRRIEANQAFLATAEEPVISFHPVMAQHFHEEVQNLLGTLQDEATRAEASAIVRSLIERVILTPHPTEDRLVVDLVGDLAGILSVAAKRDRDSISSDLSKLQPVQQTGEHEEAQNSAISSMLPVMVAGARSSHGQRGYEKTPETGVSSATSVMVAGTGLGHKPQISGGAPEGGVSASSVMVAGVGFEPTTFRL